MSDPKDLGEMASNVTANTDDLSKAVTDPAYAVGAVDGVVSVDEFKRQKDNPTQVPLGKTA
jgi:hypothetical protein